MRGKTFCDKVFKQCDKGIVDGCERYRKTSTKKLFHTLRIEHMKKYKNIESFKSSEEDAAVMEHDDGRLMSGTQKQSLRAVFADYEAAEKS